MKDVSGVVSVDQTPIRGSRRSNPATYTDLLEPIRKAFAKANGVKPALFSANSEGACPTCNGAGVICTDLAMMAGVTTVCEECEGEFEALDSALDGRALAVASALAGEMLRVFPVDVGLLETRDADTPPFALVEAVGGKRTAGSALTISSPLRVLMQRSTSS